MSNPSQRLRQLLQVPTTAATSTGTTTPSPSIPTVYFSPELCQQFLAQLSGAANTTGSIIVVPELLNTPNIAQYEAAQFLHLLLSKETQRKAADILRSYNLGQRTAAQSGIFFNYGPSS
jgi:hypothetical protein